MRRTIVFLTPTYRAAGGVIKIMDYALHARSHDFEVEIRCPSAFQRELPLFRTGQAGRLLDDPGVRFQQGMGFGLGRNDYSFFSWPKHYHLAASRITPSHHPLQTISIVQGTRWANPLWLDGYATRILGQPMGRILVTPQIAEVVAPYLDPTFPTRTILEGHDWPFFSMARTGGLPDRPNIAYLTWKSEVGIEVERRLEPSARFEFRSIRTTADWDALRDLYQWADIFLGFPGEEEGFYLPGLEAMAAGAVVIMPDVGGNRAYAHFGTNCLQVDHDDPSSYIDAIEGLVADQGAAERLRAAAYQQLPAHDLERERTEFGSYLNTLDELIYS